MHEIHGEQPGVLETERLAVGYDGRIVIGDIRFTALPGSVVTLIGPNGAGKSTILKTLLRLLPPVAGAVFLDGRNVRDLPPEEMARSVSAVLTTRPQPERMTCWEVVSAGRYPYTGRLGILSRRDREVVAESMALVQVTELREMDFNRVSDGQRQRVLLARAICQEPRVLILDEPTSFLDLRHKLDFLYLLRQLAREKHLAVILSLHELDMAQRFSDTVLCVRSGAVDRAGTPEEIFSGNYIEELYGVERGSYDALLGCVEPAAVTGRPQVFVIGGGGSGIPVYRTLQRMGLPFAAGVLQENDLDLPVARALAARTVTERAFEPVGETALGQAKALLAQCAYLVCTVERFGTMNQRNRELLDLAHTRNMVRQLEELKKCLHFPP